MGPRGESILLITTFGHWCPSVTAALSLQFPLFSYMDNGLKWKSLLELEVFGVICPQYLCKQISDLVKNNFFYDNIKYQSNYQCQSFSCRLSYLKVQGRFHYRLISSIETETKIKLENHFITIQHRIINSSKMSSINAKTVE